MGSKTYWLKSDHKTVEKLSWQQYEKLRDSKKNYVLAVVWKSEVYLFNKHAGITIYRHQLEKVWGDSEE